LSTCAAHDETLLDDEPKAETLQQQNAAQQNAAQLLMRRHTAAFVLTAVPDSAQCLHP